MSLQPIKIWGHWGGPNPWKVIILLEELALPYELRLVEFSDVKKPEYLEVTPNGRLPTIKDPNTGILLWESAAIILYLIEQYDKEGKLSYNQLPERYLTQQWLAFQASGQGPYYGQATWFARFHPEKLPSATERYVNEVIRVIGVLEEGLARNGTGWLVGDKCTYADLSFITWNGVGEGLLQELNKADKLEEDYPRYTAWMKSLKGREKVARCMALIAEARVAHGLR
ncbi:Ribosomal protein S15P [Penicillium atrosanguineum]|uniref:Glutathione S-transferase n=1 Tax=Penicillium atrosanguineum TaxID=1132637 RepID=A0A9W9U8P8_9EURO|nr:Ribosomal protein S15P [Penicillium atrosanguineum]KAJ5134300.1 glutathione S-transferase [Penicillium atrosanguineum]KAJ5304410.1 Ribosomal protein S15P [Penicillium atrosanguineum]KAJ5323883.1 glutathione S-transferase [Penicillium atrosanguineum]